MISDHEVRWMEMSSTEVSSHLSTNWQNQLQNHHISLFLVCESDLEVSFKDADLNVSNHAKCISSMFVQIFVLCGVTAVLAGSSLAVDQFVLVHSDIHE